MSNFAFLRDEFQPLWESATRMERIAMADARAGCFYARRTVEQLTSWLYEHDRNLKTPYSTKLAALLEEPTFSKVVDPQIRAKLNFVRLLGNQAVHSRKRIRQWDALQATKEVFHCCFWLVSHYTRLSPKILEGVEFDQSLLETKSIAKEDQATVEKLKKLEDELAAKDRELEEQKKTAADYDAEIERLREEIANARDRNETIDLDHDYNEAETRDRFIDLLLREAGWDPDFDDGTHKTREYPVQGMPNQSGEGFADYVLWSDDGKPLAVVEAKRTKKDARVGRNQAKLYADCLEESEGTRPIIFYSNGYEHWIWDDERYPPRAIQGFLKADELKLMIQRRSSAKDLAKATIDKNIAGRYYQEQAIRHITESMSQSQRKALIVMATGSGKTRTTIALIDLLQRCNWVKRVLFLADRVALVNQAVNAFKDHLPQCNPVNLGTQKEEATSRVYASTYPTMMGLIDDSVEGEKRFGVGHFDLVVLDEAHRSVYRKYRAIFDYFDCCLVGLTATPRDEVDRDTYSLFELARGVPTYAYELEQAVEDGYLVPPRLVSVPIKYPLQGIDKYEDLTEEDREEWDMLDWDEGGNVPDRIEAAAVNKWLFNIDTVDKVLEHVMRNGLRVDAGQRIGKTIIFAKNHDHAMFIQERFDANYPHLKGRFAKVIDNQETYAEDLIDKFSIQKNAPQDAPQIAISVDMLDTGIDVPDVVNLVFFKVVRSKTKFWQMIGRGTRLCPDLYGEDEPKENFFVFDFCGNFEFFNENPDGIEGSTQEPIGSRLFRTRLSLLQTLREQRRHDQTESARVAERSESPLTEFEQQLVDGLHGEVCSMNTDNFIVRPKRQQVETYQVRPRWEELSAQDFASLYNDVAELPTQLEPEHPTAKFFDLLMLRIQLGTLQSDPAVSSLIQRVQELASKLEDVESHPAVKAQIVLIQELQGDDYWEGVTVPMLETARRKLRDLIQHIEKGSRKIVTTNFEDDIREGVEVNLPNLSSAIDRAQYKRKFQEFIKAHEDHLTLKKVKYNEPLTRLDLEQLEQMLFESGELGSKDEFESCYGAQKSLGVFVRKLVGLNREAAKKAFDDYLDSTTFNSKQIQFVNQIVDYLTQNGVMDPSMLFEHPFTNLSPGGPTSLFNEDDTGRIVDIIRAFEANAKVG